MNRFLVILFVSGFTLIGYCDTIDNWQVYYNDSIIAKYNSNSQDLTIKIDQSSIRDLDSISIQYGDDTPCHTCIEFFYARDEKQVLLIRTQNETSKGKLSLRIQELIYRSKPNSSKQYNFYYREENSSGIKPKDVPVFKLILK